MIWEGLWLGFWFGSGVVVAAGVVVVAAGVVVVAAGVVVDVVVDVVVTAGVVVGVGSAKAGLMILLITGLTHRSGNMDDTATAPLPIRILFKNFLLILNNLDVSSLFLSVATLSSPVAIFRSPQVLFQ